MQDGIPPRKRLSIYDEPSTPVVLAPAKPSAVEVALRSTRHSVSATFAETRTTLQSYATAYIDFEQRTLASLRPFTSPSEPLLPNALYVALATSGGLVMTASSKRAMPRIVVPMGLGAAAVAWWYPQTSQKVLGAVASKTGIDTQWAALTSSVNKSVEDAKTTMSSQYKEASEKIVGGINSVTGGASDNRK
ncbi:hypothetical protein HDU98_007483 [Podochytrium sp. JEL0797]|nr:hypothetical protein HDU98_007483 [Podochytrium sp. JEL0797]